MTQNNMNEIAGIQAHVKKSLLKGAAVLVGCEESQAVTKALRSMGINAWSCDTQECSGGKPEWHLQMDIFKAIRLRKWNMILFFPPCTKICVSGNRHYAKGKPKHYERKQAVAWTQKLWNEAIKNCDYVAMENPQGVLNKCGYFPIPFYIQPYQFGHGETKKTGLWLRGLPPLRPTRNVKGRRNRIWREFGGGNSEHGKLRSKTYPGIAKAMAKQWGLLAVAPLSNVF